MTAETSALAPATNEHLVFLEAKVFQVATKWPHYRRLLADLAEIAAQTPSGSKIACLERAFIFDGRSLFAALFDGHDFHAHDVRLEGLEEARMGYQAHWLDDPRCDARPAHSAGLVTELPFDDASVDVVVVPNVVHHVRDQDGMFREIARVLRPGGRGFIFETLLRELHQAPHDFVRWTPWGFEDRLAAAGLRMTEHRPAGGPFEAVAYCWDQALQYLPEPLRSEKRRWFEERAFPELMDLNATYADNQVRAHTSFPIAYGVHFVKPRD